MSENFTLFVVVNYIIYLDFKHLILLEKSYINYIIGVQNQIDIYFFFFHITHNFFQLISIKLKLNGFYTFPESRAITLPCKCENSKCSCCSGNILQNFNLNMRQRLCTNITYNPDDFEFNVRILFNDYTVYNRVVSGMNVYRIT